VGPVTGVIQFGSLRPASTVIRKSKMPTMKTSVVSLNRPMVVLTMFGMVILSACGNTISRIVCQ